MKAERWEQVKEIFNGALGLKGTERAKYLESLCGDDAELRSEVESLLESAGGNDTFLEKPAMEAAARLMSEEKAADVLGRELGNYTVLKLIGAGGMGEVYLARDRRLGRKVALKLLPEYFTKDAERLRRFQREARAISALNHPNILTVYEIGQAGDHNFIATEFIDGQTLRERIRTGTLSAGEAVEVAAQVASALSAAHEAGIIHRDIKPENIMVRKDGYVKVLDFGLAKLAEGSGEAQGGGEGSSQVSTQALVHTASGVIMGTALYMSPEQARGLEVDARTDIWSLGGVLYEMLAGRPPFEGETPSHVIVSILDDEPPPLSSKAKVAVPAELEEVVMRALSKKREARYKSAGEMAAALRAFRQRLDVLAALQQDSRSDDVAAIQEAQSSPAPAHASAAENVAPTGGADAKQTELVSAGRAAATERRWPGQWVAAATVGVGLMAFLFGFVLYKWMRATSGPGATLFARARLAKLTTNGKAGHAAISPDGKYVVFVSGERGRQTLVLKHVPTGSDKEIVPAAGDYSNPTFTPDGNYIYYRRAEKSQSVLYRVPVLGDVAPVKIAEDVDSAISFSPDGRRFVVVRGYPHQGENALMLFNADGTGEERLLVKKGGNTLFSSGAGGIAFGPSWSPDGETIAFVMRDTLNGVAVNRLKGVGVRDGAEKDLTGQTWESIGQVAWRRDGRGLLLAAADDSAGAFQQVWHVDYPSGAARRVTNDLSFYFGVSLTADSSSLVTMQGERLSSVWVLPAGDTKGGAKISTGKTEGDYGLSWAPDGRIVYTSGTTGAQDIWIANADGSGMKQLTRNAGHNSAPVVSPDGRYIVFVSSRSGERRIWRMDIDGGNPLQLSSGKEDQSPFCTPDGKWVVYVESITVTLWKIPIDGGSAVQLTDYVALRPAVSPDGRRVAVMFIDEEAQPKRYRMGLVSIDGGRPEKVFDAPHPSMSRGRFVWTPDSRTVIYIKTEGGLSNLWGQPVEGGEPRRLTDFNTDQLFWFDYTRDGRQLAVARGTQTSDVVLISDQK